MEDINPHLILGSLGSPESAPKRHLDRISRFCRFTNLTNTQTNRPTDRPRYFLHDNRPLSLAIAAMWPNNDVVNVIWQKAASPPCTNRSIVCNLKTFRLNGFKIKRVTLPYIAWRYYACYFLGIKANAICHWLKRDAAAVMRCVACRLLLEFEKL